MAYERAKYVGYTVGVAVVVGIGMLALPGQYLQSTTVPALSVVNDLTVSGSIGIGITPATGRLHVSNTTMTGFNAITASQTLVASTVNLSGVRAANNTSLDCSGGTRTAYGGNFSAAPTESNAGTSIAIGLTSTASGGDVNVAYEGVAGNNYFNTSSGNTCIGIATAGTCAAKLTLTGDATVSTTLSTGGNFTAGDANPDKMTQWGHLQTEGTSPATSSCGTGSSVVGSDTAFRSVSGNTTTCTWTFSRTFTAIPVCVARVEGTATQPTCTVSATAITCTTLIAATTYHWMCFGVTGGT